MTPLMGFFLRCLAAVVLAILLWALADQAMAATTWHVAAAPAVLHDVRAGEVARSEGAETAELALLGLSLLLYLHGVARLWRHAAPGRGLGLPQALAFAGGWATLAVALLSPLDALGARLFSAHMVQHELLMLVAAPLFVLARPLAAWGWALPRPWLKSVGAFFHHPAWLGPWRTITAPMGAWALHALALWVWHLPALFDAALHHEGVHALQHASFLGTALLFWWSLLGADARSRQAIVPGLLSLFTTMLHTGALGALLTLAPQPWYMEGGPQPMPWGLDPLSDQQLGGLLMWVPGSLAYLACALWLGARLLSPQADRAPARPPRPAPPGQPRPGAP